MVPIITSIPPRLIRYDRDGREIGLEYQKACIESWRRQGFTVHSVNAKSELDEMPRNPDVMYWPVERDSRKLTGRPLVWFHDLLQKCSEIAEGPFILTNADIMLQASSDATDLTAAISPGNAFISKRVDIEDPAFTTGSRYCFGYDVFGIHSTDLNKIKNANLIFGCPWWDFFLPYSLILNNVSLFTNDDLTGLHLLHQERWSMESWVALGRNYLNFVEERVWQSPPAYSDAIESALSRKPPLIKRVRQGKEKTEKKALSQASRVSLDFIDHQASVSLVYQRPLKM